MPSVTFADFDGGIDLTRPSKLQGANRFRSLVNAYITKGKTIKKRPGCKFVWSWGPGVKGFHAIGGALRGYYGAGNTNITQPIVGAFVQSQGKFLVHRLQYGVDATGGYNQVEGISSAFRYNGGQYVVTRTQAGFRHHYFTGSPAIQTDITDVNCPHGSSAVTLQQKVFAVSPTGVVRFTASLQPGVNYTAPNDAGFLPVNNQTTGSQQPIAVGEFLKKLVVLYPSATQIWNVGPDPQSHSFDQRIAIGSNFEDSHSNVGTDLFFGSTAGVRSVTLNSNALTSSALDLDVGTPVDNLYLEKIKTLSGAVIGRYFPSLGQYWFITGSSALVYSFSRTSKIYAWSEYNFPWAVGGADELDGIVYLRSTDGDIYEFADGYTVDDNASLAVSNTGIARDPTAWINGGMPAAGQSVIELRIRTPFFDMKNPAATKHIEAFDIVSTRENRRASTPYLEEFYEMQFLYRSDSGTGGFVGSEFIGGPINMDELPDDTRPHGHLPLGLCAPTFSVDLVHTIPEDIEISALVFHYESMGWQI